MRSLKQQILLLVISTVLCTLVVAAVIAAFGFERELKLASVRRTETLAGQAAAVLRAHAADALKKADTARATVAAEPDLRRRRNALAAVAGADADLIAAIISSPDSVERLRAAGPLADSIPASALDAEPVDSTVVGPIRTAGSLHLYDVALPLGTGESTERLVLRRRIGRDAVRALVSELGGTDAVLLLGTGGGSWSDLTQPVAAPQPESETSYRWRGDSIFDGTMVRVDGTPWKVWVGTPRAAVIAPTRVMVTGIGAAGLIVLGISAVLGLVLVRRVMRPLDSLTQSMHQIAGGRYRLRVPEEGPAEILALSEAVNSMADRIEEGTDRREHRIDQRTAELEAQLKELREGQEQVVRSERLGMLGQMAGIIGGELRNPLRAMSNAIYYLEIVSHSSAPVVKENYATLRYQILIAEKVVADLLDFAEIRSPEKERVDIRSVLDEQVRRLGNPNGISVIREYHPQMPAVTIDPTQIGRATLNILTNAVQVMESGGRITIRVFPDGHAVSITIEDTGPGIPEEDLPRIFEPLFTKRAHGIGLGLSVARALVEANGGSIQVTSGTGSGACFRIQFPAA